jgi:hypothetical protein
MPEQLVSPWTGLSASIRRVAARGAIHGLSIFPSDPDNIIKKDRGAVTVLVRAAREVRQLLRKL